MHFPIRIALFVLASSALWTVSARGDAPPPAPYQPQGAPADPKVSAQWNRYHDHAEATKLLHSIVAAHPKLAKLQSLGLSYGKREMWVLTVTNLESGDDRVKPAFWIQGGIHANEIQGPEVALYTAWYLTEMYGHAAFVTQLLDRRTLYILPMLSPDSRDAHFYKPNSTHSPRSGLRPVDDDRDGLFDEDGADDIDGDGHITQMRVRDPNGRWKPHPDFPNLMIPCREDEPGQYRLLGEEGYDNDGDGRVNEDGPGGYDPNRDWPWGWLPRYVRGTAYRYPLAVLENRMAADFISDHPNIAAAQSYHNFGGWILRGPGEREDNYDPADVAVYDTIGRRGEQLLPGYKYATIGKDLYPVGGGDLDWMYQMRGIYAFTNELFSPQNYFRKPSEGAGRQEDLQNFDKYLLFNEGTVPWHPVDHPQFGKIEVGGLKKNWVRQPPSFLLEEECHRNMAFSLYHVDQMPQVSVQSVDVKPMEGNLLEVTAVVANSRMTPTRAAVDVKRNLSAPDVVTLEGRELRVLAGMRSEEPFFREPHPQKRHPGAVSVPSIPGMGAVYVRWIAEGKGPLSVSVYSKKGGRDRREVQGAGK